MSFLDRYGMDETERRDRQAFLGLTADDAANVRMLHDAFARWARQFAERFYQHLLADPHTAAFLRDPQQLEQLKTIQANYFAELLRGTFDESYFESRLRVGAAHQRIGLTPVWYLGAYNQYIQITFPLFVKAFGDDLEQVLPRLLSLVKVIFLDIGLALDTYFQEATAQLRQRNEELQRALSLYWDAQQREEQMRKMASHEVRGGLAAVITGLEDLLDEGQGSFSPDLAEQIEQLGRRCWSLSNLLGEMLAPQAGPSGPEWVETSGIFEQLLGRFGLYAEGRSVQLHLAPDPPRVWADPRQLREVFANLVANAVNYLDKEDGHVEITWERDGDFWVFSVADNGPGIHPSVQERLFEPFVRGPQPPGASAAAGTGLGLYFVRTVVEQGGGKVGVASTPGKGSRFSFTVPAQPPAGDPSDRGP
jgi:signal transduction histidine kinase